VRSFLRAIVPCRPAQVWAARLDRARAPGPQLLKGPPRGVGRHKGRKAHENQNAPFMIVPMALAEGRRIMPSTRDDRPFRLRRHIMKWETPGMRLTPFRH